MGRKFIDVVLQEFLEGYGLDKQTKYSYDLLSTAEESFQKKLNKNQLDEYEKLDDLKSEINLHEFERLIEFMFHFLQV